MKLSENDAVCAYAPNSNQPCAECPRKITALYCCGLLQEGAKETRIMNHPDYQEAYDAVTKMIGNTNVSMETTLEALEEIGSMIEAQIAAIKEEIDE